MWPECIYHLSPFACEIKPYTPEFLEKEWDAIKPISKYKAPFPVRLVSFLGQCSTDAYPDCPSLPEHHKINALVYEKPLKEWLSYIGLGKYCWLDFDIVWRPNDSLQLRVPLTSQERTHNEKGWEDASSMPVRMTYNIGTGTSDGIWGVAWHRQTGEVIASLKNFGSDETTICTVSQKYSDMCEAHLSLIPVVLWNRTRLNCPIYRAPQYYANGAKIERLIGLAIDLCQWYNQID